MAAPLRSIPGWRVAWGLLIGSTAVADSPAPFPQVHEPGITIRLLAAEPDLVAPIGLAIGPDDRIHVVESRTRLHPRPGGGGPATDRVLVFTDADGDGRAEGRGVFADGFRHALNLACLPGGDLVLVCAREVWRLGDDDGDGRADRRERLLELATPNTHPHSALLGAAAGDGGWLYVSRGHNAGLPWRLRDAGGAGFAGEGDGGAVVRCRLDGTGLESFATGFRNPFALALDAAGRLVVADNDPDARGPNRLLHAVAGGDYGYRARHGDGGTHPFQGWDADRPGTLPIAAALDEAPAGLLDARGTGLALPGTDSLLVTSWAGHRIDRLRVQPAGTSFTATRQPLVTGGPEFHPVALAVDSRGIVHVTDWVLGGYTGHSRGRLWSIRGTSPGTPDPGARARDRRASRSMRELERIAATSPRGGRRIRAALADADPFRAHAAFRALSLPSHGEIRARLRADRDPRIRAAALRAGEQAGDTDPDPLRAALGDADPEVRRTALLLAGERGDPALRPHLDRALDGVGLTPRLFATHRAAVEALTGGDRVAAEREAEWLERFIDDPENPGPVRALALTRLVSDRPAGHRSRLVAALDDPAPGVVSAAVHALAEASGPEADAALRRLARDAGRPVALRAAALVSLGGRHDPGVEELLPLLEDPEPDVAYEAARLLRSHVAHEEHPGVREAFLRMADVPDTTPRGEVVRMALGRLEPPDSPEAWARALDGDIAGDAERGRRVFFSAQAACAGCHRVGDHGREVGPELTQVARSLDRTRLIRSILEPSAESAPEYQGGYVETRDGPVHQGLRLQEQSDGSVALWVPGTGTVRVDAAEVVDAGPLSGSLMPEGLAQALTPAEFRDLVAYLESLR